MPTELARSLALALLLAAGLATPARPGAPLPAGPLTQSGRFFLDSDRRVVLLRGVNYSHRAKSAPYRGWQKREHFEQMRAWGFNCVRYLLEWAAVEPEPGRLDTAYLEHLEQVLGWARENGIRVVLDMHQDLYSAKFGGNGAPDWAAEEAPAMKGGEQGAWFLRYFSREVMASFARLWTDERLLESYCAAWRAVAARTRRHPNVIGYDLMNEPFSGTSLPARFERTSLSSFYARVAAAIRQSDPSAAIFFEPAAVVNVSTMVCNVTPPPGPVVYAPHFYDSMLLMRLPSPACGAYARKACETMTRQAAKYGSPLFVGEFGVMQDLPAAREALAEQCDALDRVLAAGWTAWNYNPDLDTNTGIEPDRYSLVGRDGADNPGTDVLVRPYAQAVAGVPERMRFDLAAGRFELVVAAAQPPGETVVHLPARHFPSFEVEAPGTWTFDPEQRLLRWSHPRTRESQTLTVRSRVATR